MCNIFYLGILVRFRKREITMAIIGTMYFSPESTYNGKKIQDMTEDEKKAVISRFQAKGSKCIIIGYNDEKEGE